MTTQGLHVVPLYESTAALLKLPPILTGRGGTPSPAKLLGSLSEVAEGQSAETTWASGPSRCWASGQHSLTRLISPATQSGTLANVT